MKSLVKGPIVREVRSIAVVGAGYMGGGIAQLFAIAGFPVRLADVSVEAANAALERLIEEAADFEAEQLFPPGSAEKVAANLSAGMDLAEAVAEADFIEEAVFENLELKRDVLGRISQAAQRDAIIGTNTSTLPVRELATSVLAPERFLTVHFSNPAPFIPGVELVPGSETDPSVTEAVKKLLLRIGKRGAVLRDSPGMVVNRLQYALLREAFLTLEDGVASAEDIDLLVRTTFGFRLGIFGPFAIVDQAGIDVYAAGFKTLEDAYGDRYRAPRLLVQAASNGQHGLKNGRGLMREFTDDDREQLVAYRNRAYVKMGKLMADIGPSPLEASGSDQASHTLRSSDVPTNP